MVHVATSPIIDTLFFSRTTYSSVGDAWQALAQILNSKDAQDILRRGTLLSDREVEADIKAAGLSRRKYRLTFHEESAEVTLGVLAGPEWKPLLHERKAGGKRTGADLYESISLTERRRSSANVRLLSGDDSRSGKG